jgi:multidrug resistance efflux pump
METLQNQLSSSEEQVKVAVEQLNTTNVYSDVDGVAETVMVKRGELFAGMGQIKIVNTSKLKVVCIVPENYIGRVKKGVNVMIEIPETGQRFASTINLVGQTIENTQRGFIVEAALPASNMFKPNQTVVVKIADYSASNAIVIPVNTLQSDEQNK